MVCGTGGWGGPLPGDPSSGSTLTATPAFGGIDVEWTYPLLNPHAVSHTLLYRGTSPDFAFAVQHKVVSGNFFYDKSASATPILYYYWIRFISINGTPGDLIGPASATARPTIEDMIELLTEQIDNGVLATALRGEIARIDENYLALLQEQVDRAASDDALGAAYTVVEAHSEGTRALLLEEVLARTTANSAFVEAVNTVQATLEDDIASVEVTMGAEITAVEGIVTSIGARWTAIVDVNGLVGGFGVYNNGAFVEAGFDVDRFWIGRTSLTQKKPFIVEGSEVFIDQAVINKLVFSRLRNEAGSFVVDPDGLLKTEFINTKGMLIRDAAGTILFGSGYPIDYSVVGGTKPPTNADNTASNTAAGLAGQGWMATLNQITAANATTYIQSAAIPRALIGALNVGTADIVNAAVGTLKIAGNAATVMVGAQSGAGPCSVTVVVTADDIPSGYSTVPIMVNTSRHQPGSAYFDLGVSVNGAAMTVLFSSLPENGVWAYTWIYNAAPGTYVFTNYDQGGAYPIYTSSITAILGKR